MWDVIFSVRILKSHGSEWVTTQNSCYSLFPIATFKFKYVDQKLLTNHGCVVDLKQLLCLTTLKWSKIIIGQS